MQNTILLFILLFVGIYGLYCLVFQQKPTPPVVAQHLRKSGNSENLSEPITPISFESNVTEASELAPSEVNDIEMYYRSHKEKIKNESHDKELNFLVLGDFGYIDEDKPNPEQLELGQLISDRVMRTFRSYDFIISVGDNFYPYGLDSHNDNKPEILLEDTFQMSALGLDWYSILGNHDLIGDLSAVLKLNEKYPLWKQTEPYYYRIFNIGNSPQKAGFIFLNSCDLVCRNKFSPECFDHMWGNVKFNEVQKQIDWLDNVLSQMAEDNEIIWKIMVIHNAIFSAGQRHGDNEDLKELVLPLLVKYKVDLVLSGHDHSVQYLRMDMGSYLEAQSSEKQKIEEDAQPDCPKKPNYRYCSEDEFLHYYLDKCGILKEFKEPVHLRSMAHSKSDSLFNTFDTKYSRESMSSQYDYLHQFVLGNGGTKHEKLCPVMQMKSEGKLRYGHSVSGIADIRIKEDRMDIDLVSVSNELLYSVKIFRDMETSEKEDL